MKQNYFQSIGLNPMGINPMTGQKYTFDEMKAAYRNTAKECRQATLIDAPKEMKVRLQNANVAWRVLRDDKLRQQHYAEIGNLNTDQTTSSSNRRQSYDKPPAASYEDILRETEEIIRAETRRRFNEGFKDTEEAILELLAKHKKTREQAKATGRSVSEQFIFEYHQAEDRKMIAVGIVTLACLGYLAITYLQATGYKYSDFSKLGRDITGNITAVFSKRPLSTCSANKLTCDPNQ